VAATAVPLKGMEIVVVELPLEAMERVAEVERVPIVEGLKAMLKVALCPAATVRLVPELPRLKTIPEMADAVIVTAALPRFVTVKV